MPARFSPLFLIGLIFLLGCNASTSPPSEATRRSPGGRMPAGNPKFESFYVADQSTIKMVSARTVPDKPLESFRGEKAEPGASAENEDADKNAASKKSKKKAADDSDEESAESKPKAAGGFWTKLGAKAASGAAKAASKGDKDNADDEEKNPPPPPPPKKPRIGG